MLTSLDKLNAQDFRRQLRTGFKVQAGGAQTVVLELVEVQEREDAMPQQAKSGAAEGPPSPPRQMEFFCLHFHGPYQPRLAQQIHRLEHAQLGAIEIFLTPISSEPQPGTLYEAIFHRFRPQP
jgi:uncharacterized protein DUF6916